MSINGFILEHYSSKPISKLGPIKPNRHSRHPYLKPSGFWVSVKGEDDWPSWCKAEVFGVERLSVCHRVQLRQGANVLVVSSVQKLDEFHNKYQTEGLPWSQGINWPRAKEDYGGLIIAPYQWLRRLDLTWYYGWDCASGVIWDLSVIESISVHKEADCVS